MGDLGVTFDHIHIISRDPAAAAAWYADMLGGEIAKVGETRGAPQISVVFGSVTILVRGQRAGEQPGAKNSLRHFDGFISHDEWGTDHFGFTVLGDLDEFCAALGQKGATFSVEPYDFLPGSRIAYVEAPDGVTVELVQAKI